MENSLKVPQKVKHGVIIWPINSTLTYIPKRNENICHRKTYTQMSTPLLFIIAKRWKQPKRPPIRWVDKMWYIHAVECYLAIKKEWSTDTCYMNEPWKHFGKWKKLVTKAHILYDPIYMKCPSSKNLETINAGDGVEKREHSCTVGGNVNWYSQYGEQYGGSLKN